MTGSRDWLEPVVAAAVRLRDAAAARDAALAGPPPLALVGVGVATVDHERLAGQLAGNWVPVPRDPLLGAIARRLATKPGAGIRPVVLLLEPDTEGPLAATLARFGEGLAAVYVRPARPPVGRLAASGPLGPARLVPGPAYGPHGIALEPGATIDR
ncbi:MAG TPA: hypothetical protein VK831_00965 [Candidatus Deferrimicrobiaceae bacterium]|nr:hypothetical protein [Candidatus Deferrimicrobiaceae bacterium]